ncbi:hypothetical protein PR202_gb07096 [Eleusine coracana subsp. coracana]|uniref:Uncharacterized protein n=1 Tax=Eleusine coracana subsp. coracana TaxID=191504 RepID=A0AAV5EAI4_ELECO|nr:hypothetical protein PR202_gb07096 [Eleusine coracana subsp. coracana]
MCVSTRVADVVGDGETAVAEAGLGVLSATNTSAVSGVVEIDTIVCSAIMSVATAFASAMSMTLRPPGQRLFLLRWAGAPGVGSAQGKAQSWPDSWEARDSNLHREQRGHACCVEE